MEEEQQDQEYQQQMDNAYYNNVSALQIRLNTEELLNRIELFLKGKLERYMPDANGQVVMKTVEIGKPLANEKGIQSILNYISMIANPQVVQGNFDGERYDNYVEEVHMNFNTIIMTNLYSWDVKTTDIDYIEDSIMMLLVPFLTRLIDNKERESYSTTIKSIESVSNQPKQQQGFLSGLFSKKN